MPPKKKRKSKNRKPFSNEAKKYLLDRDIGKWHEQDTIEHRQKLLNTDGVDSETIRTAVAPPKVKPCASAQKIDAARQHMWMDAESEVSESEDEDDESENGDPKHGHLRPPQHLWIVDLSAMETNLNSCMCCKYCHGPMDIFEDSKARQGLGTKIQFKCKNDLCSSQKFEHAFFATSKKAGQNKFDINERNVLANRLIGKGRANSEKYCSIMGLARPIRRTAWKKHATIVDAAAINAKDASIKRAAERVKIAGSETGKTMIETPTSFDASWSSRGWTARDGVVAAIAEETSQVLDVLALTNGCPQCTELKNLMDEGKLSSDDHMERYLQHEEECCVNHEGSSSVSSRKFVRLCFPIQFGKRE